MNLSNINFQPIQPWIVILFILSALVVMMLYVKRSKGYKKIPLLFRLFLFLCILFIIFQPAKSIRQKLIDKPALAVLIDTSGSMGAKDPVLRLSSVKKLVNENSRFIQNLRKTYAIYPFIFSATLEHSSIKDIFQIKLPQGQATDIGLALKQVSKELEGKHLSGIVIISDGIHNGQWAPLDVARGLGIPVVSIGVGNREQFKDMAINEVKVSDFVFSNTPVKVEVALTGKGYRNQDVSVILKQGVKIIKTKKVRIPDGEIIKVNFEFTPQDTGNFTYTVNIPHYKGEFSLENNSKDFNLEVLREKIRVLYICGEPSWEYKFLREVLKSNPNIELVSFIILRNPENISIVPEHELSLIPFPTHEIFMKELFEFDLLIFENFSYAKFFPRSYLENIKKFVVDKGKAFIMLGGDKSFGRGGYKNTSIDEILPVKLAVGQEKMVPGEFRLKITNSSHPIVALKDTLKETQDVWNNMPQLDTSNKILSAKPTAVTLGVHPWASENGANIPVLVVWGKGKGRVMALTSNSTWRWSMGLAAQGKTNFLYNLFWKRAIRWLIKAPEVKLVNVTCDKKQYLKDEKINVIIRVFDEYYHPLENAKVNLEVINPVGKKIDLENKIIEIQPGKYEVEFDSDLIGKYTFNAVAYKSGRFLAKDSSFCEVAMPDIELARLWLNEDLLKQIAEITEGKYFHIEDMQEDTQILPKAALSQATMTSRQKSLWDSVYLYFIILFLLAAEWYIRRKSGML